MPELCSTLGLPLYFSLDPPPGSQTLGTVILCPDVGGIHTGPNISFSRTLRGRGFRVVALDVFRGDPWTPDRDRSEYEDWRSRHPAHQVTEDIAAAR